MHPPVTRFTYRAFISYSHADKAWADWLHKALETYRVPSRLVGTRTAAGTIPRRLNPIFRDREELASATDLGRKVEQALAQSANLIVVCSPAAAASRWVNQEVLGYQRMGRGDRIFCLITGGEPNASDLPGRAAEECFCTALRQRFDRHGQPTGERIEPIAADVRPGKDGKPNARLKLIAGMLDVGFDQLKQREQQRRVRRMTAVTALALVVMAITVALAAFAWISRDHALAARQQAEVARQAAERRQKQAEGLVNFMLGDLNDKLEQVHRLDIMQAVDDKAMAYFRSLPAADATDATLGMRVTALEKIGSVRMEQGNLPQALQAYQAASALATERVRRAPADPDRQASYADSLKWVGQAYWYQGDLARALQKFEAAGDALQTALAGRPADPGFRASLAYVHTDSGRVLEARGELAAARRQYEAVLDIFRGLEAAQPAVARWQSEVGFAWNNLGALAVRQGRLEDAIVAYRSDQRIKAGLAAAAPENRAAAEDLLVSNAILGRTLALCGDLPGALHYTRAAVDSARSLVAFDSTNANWQEYLALYSQQLAGLLRQDGHPDPADAAGHRAVEILATLVAKDPDGADYRQELAQARLEWARNRLAAGQPQAAAGAVRTALATLQSMHAAAPDEPGLALALAQALNLSGSIAARHHAADTARREWRAAGDLLATWAASGSDPRLLATYAEALLRMGDDGGAAPIVARLAAMGYRTPDFVALVTGAKLAYPINAAFAQRIAQIGQAPDAE